MNEVWQWFVKNWGIIRLVLVVVAGVASIIFVKYKGDLMKFALMVWGSILELAHEGLDVVDQDTINAIVDPLWEYVVATKFGYVLRLFLTKERLRAMAWKLWCEFRDALDDDPDADPTWAGYLHAARMSRARLAASRRVSAGAPFSKIK